jgi:hypothetical protein
MSLKFGGDGFQKACAVFGVQRRRRVLNNLHLAVGKSNHFVKLRFRFRRWRGGSTLIGVTDMIATAMAIAATKPMPGISR